MRQIITKCMVIPIILLLFTPALSRAVPSQPVMIYGGGAAGPLAFSPDGKTCAIGRGKYLMLMDVESGKCLRILCGHQQLVIGAAFSADGSKIVSMSHEGRPSPDDHATTGSTGFNNGAFAKIWNSADGNCLGTVAEEVQSTQSMIGMGVAISSDGKRIAMGSVGNAAKCWNAETGEYLFTLEGHDRPVQTIAFSSDGALILTGTGDQTARIWDGKSGKCLQILKGHSSSIFAVAFSPDRKMAATGSADKTARVWDVATGKQTHKMNCGYSVFRPRMGRTGGEDFFGPMPPEDLVISVAFSPDGGSLLSGISNGEVTEWSATTGKRIRDIHTNVKVKDIRQKESGLCNRIFFSKDQSRIMTSPLDGKIRIWDSHSEKCIQTLGGHGNREIVSLAVSPVGDIMATGGSDGTGCLWSITEGRCIRSLTFENPNGYYVSGVAFSKKGDALITASDDGHSRLWEVATGEMGVDMPNPGENGLRSAGWSADGRVIVLGDGHQTAHLIDLNHELKHRKFPETPPESARSGPDLKVAISPDHTRLLTASFDDRRWLKMWDVESGQCLFTKDLGYGTENVCFSADGKTFMSGWDNGNARLWQTSDGTCLREFDMKNTKAKKNFIRCMALSPDGKYALTGQSDGQAWLWQAADGQCIKKVECGRGNVNCVAFLPDGSKFLTAARDGMAMLWETNSRE